MLPSGREHEFTSKKRGEEDFDSYLLTHFMISQDMPERRFEPQFTGKK